MARLTLEEYFVSVCEAVSHRGTCDRAQVGAVIVREKAIISTGYNGSPRGLPHCSDVGHLMERDQAGEDHCIRTVHAEANAIAQAARAGIGIDHGIIFCSTMPCYHCAQLIINSGLNEVVAIRDYHAAAKSKLLLQEAGIHFKILHV